MTLLAWVLFSLATTVSAGTLAMTFLVAPILARRTRLDPSNAMLMGFLLSALFGIVGGPAGVGLAIAVLRHTAARIVVGVLGAGVFGFAVFIAIKVAQFANGMSRAKGRSS